MTESSFAQSPKNGFPIGQQRKVPDVVATVPEMPYRLVEVLSFHDGHWNNHDPGMLG